MIQRHLVITVHGIRTFGDWQSRLANLVKTVSPDTVFYHYRYNYFSLVAFMFPPTRWLITRHFRASLLKACRDQPWDRIDCVGHSFGTHIIAWALYGIPPDRRPTIHTVILAASVLRSRFPWDQLVPTHVGRVVNECGTRDNVLLLSQFFVLFTGMAGRLGFVGMEHTNLLDRYFPFGHSDYFCRQSGDTDAEAFMKKWWVPLLTTEAAAREHDPRTAPTTVGGIANFLINNAEPIKLIAYCAPPLLVTWYVWGLYTGEREQRRQATVQLTRAILFSVRGLVNAGDISMARTELAKSPRAVLDAPILRILQAEATRQEISDIDRQATDGDAVDLDNRVCLGLQAFSIRPHQTSRHRWV